MQQKNYTKHKNEMLLVIERGDFPHESLGPVKAFAWPLLLQAAKLARKDGSRLKLTKAGEKAFPLPAHETLRLIWKEWLTLSL